MQATDETLSAVQKNMGLAKNTLGSKEMMEANRYEMHGEKMVRRAQKGKMKSEEMTSRLEDSVAGKGDGPDCSQGGYDGRKMKNPYCGECLPRIGSGIFAGQDCVYLTLFDGDFCSENRQRYGLVYANDREHHYGTYDDYDEDRELKSYGLVIADFLNTEESTWCVHWYSEIEQKGQLLDVQCCTLKQNQEYIPGDNNREGVRCAWKAEANTHRKIFKAARKPCCTKYTRSTVYRTLEPPFSYRFSGGSQEFRNYAESNGKQWQSKRMTPSHYHIQELCGDIHDACRSFCEEDSKCVAFAVKTFDSGMKSCIIMSPDDPNQKENLCFRDWWEKNMDLSDEVMYPEIYSKTEPAETSSKISDFKLSGPEQEQKCKIECEHSKTYCFGFQISTRGRDRFCTLYGSSAIGDDSSCGLDNHEQAEICSWRHQWHSAQEAAAEAQEYHPYRSAFVYEYHRRRRRVPITESCKGDLTKALDESVLEAADEWMHESEKDITGSAPVYAAENFARVRDKPYALMTTLENISDNDEKPKPDAVQGSQIVHAKFKDILATLPDPEDVSTNFKQILDTLTKGDDVARVDLLKKAQPPKVPKLPTTALSSSKLPTTTLGNVWTTMMVARDCAPTCDGINVEGCVRTLVGAVACSPPVVATVVGFAPCVFVTVGDLLYTLFRDVLGYACMSATTRMKTPSGPKVIAELVPGDKVNVLLIDGISNQNVVKTPTKVASGEMLGWAMHEDYSFGLKGGDGQIRALKKPPFSMCEISLANEKDTLKITKKHNLWAKRGDDAHLMRAQDLTSENTFLPKVIKGDVKWVKVTAVDCTKKEFAAMMPLVRADNNGPGDMLLTANDVVVPLYGGPSEFTQIPPHEFRNLFQVWLRHWEDLAREFPCLLQPSPVPKSVVHGSGRMLLVDLMAKMLEHKKHREIGEAQLDSETFLCYIHGHADDIFQDDKLNEKCPSLMKAYKNCPLLKAEKAESAAQKAQYRQAAPDDGESEALAVGSVRAVVQQFQEECPDMAKTFNICWPVEDDMGHKIEMGKDSHVSVETAVNIIERQCPALEKAYKNCSVAKAMGQAFIKEVSKQ